MKPPADLHFAVGIWGQGHFVTSHLGHNMASVTWATEMSTKWVNQIGLHEMGRMK